MSPSFKRSRARLKFVSRSRRRNAPAPRCDLKLRGQFQTAQQLAPFAQRRSQQERPSNNNRSKATNVTGTSAEDVCKQIERFGFSPEPFLQIEKCEFAILGEGDDLAIQNYLF